MISDNKIFEYYAFISHKSCDSKTALNLQKKIEKYHLPVSIVKKGSGLPKRISPVCCYENDFAANPLYRQIHDMLDRSKFLIVICSEELIKNDHTHINKEIRYYIQSGKADHIIPVIISGKVNDPEHECYPEALKELGDMQPIAIDYSSKKTRHQEFLKLIATMLGLDYGVLYNRDKKRLQNRRRIILCFAAALALALTWTGFFCIPQKKHYLDYALKYNIPEGIHQLTKEEASNMPAHYVITRQFNRVKTLEYVNAEGRLIARDDLLCDRPVKASFEYLRGNILSAVYYYDTNNVLQFSQKFVSETATVSDFRSPYCYDTPYYFESVLSYPTESIYSYEQSEDQSGSISRFSYKYNDEGYITGIVFFRNSENLLACDENNVYGLSFKVDEKGRIIEKYFLDGSANKENPNCITACDGIYCIKYGYDEDDNLSSVEYYDREGSSVEGDDGALKISYSYDTRHRTSKISYLDAENNLVYNESAKHAYRMYEYNDSVYCTGVLFYDTDGELCDIGGFYRSERKTDKNGFTSEIKYCDKDGNACDAHNGIAIIRYECDECGNKLSFSYYDADGKPFAPADKGYHKVIREYNENGQQLIERLEDENGSPALGKDVGYSIERRQYNDKGLVESLSYYDTDDLPVLRVASENLSNTNRFGYHKVIFHYSDTSDPYAKLVMEYYDTDGKLVTSKIAYTGSDKYTVNETAAVAVIYRTSGRITRMEHYDTEGALTGSPDFAVTDCAWTVDTMSRKTETITNKSADESYALTVVNTYSLNGPIEKRIMKTSSNGITQNINTYDYNENGIKTSEVFESFDENGKAYFTLKRLYDEYGQCIKKTGIDYDAGVVVGTTETLYENNIITSEKYSTLDAETGNTLLRLKKYENGELISSYKETTDSEKHPVYLCEEKYENGVTVYSETKMYNNNILTQEDIISVVKDDTGAYVKKHDYKHYDNGQVDSTLSEVYDADDRQVKYITEAFKDGQSVSYENDTYEYNSAGDVYIVYSIYRENGYALETQTIFEFDDNRNAVTMTINYIKDNEIYGYTKYALKDNEITGILERK